MAKNKRTQGERERDLEVIRHLYSMGMFLADIATELQKITNAEYTLHVTQIHYDVKEILKRWKANTAFDLDMEKKKELEKIDSVEREAWSAWRDSQGDLRKTKRHVTYRGEGGASQARKGELYSEERTGDARFLQIVINCVDRRVKLLGLDEPIKVDVNSDYVLPPKLSEEHRKQLQFVREKYGLN